MYGVDSRSACVLSDPIRLVYESDKTHVDLESNKLMYILYVNIKDTNESKLNFLTFLSSNF